MRSVNPMWWNKKASVHAMVFGTTYGNLCERAHPSQAFLCIAPRRRKMGADLVTEAKGLSLRFHHGKMIWEC